MYKCDSINGASAHKVSLSLPLLEFSDATNGADDIRTGVSSARWWILFQYSSLISILFAALLAFFRLSHILHFRYSLLTFNQGWFWDIPGPIYTTYQSM
jgi:hypothetical protein